MNLTNVMRKEIVNAVMNDVPFTWTPCKIESAVSEIIKEEMKGAPAAIQAIYKNNELRCWLAMENHNLHYMVPYERRKNSLFKNINVLKPRAPKLSETAIDKLIDMATLAEAECVALSQARVKLSAALTGIRTRKQFLERFPELEKYAPADEGKSSFLPAVANVMADLSKLGFPKDKTDKKKAKEEKAAAAVLVAS